MRVDLLIEKTFVGRALLAYDSIDRLDTDGPDVVGKTITDTFVSTLYDAPTIGIYVEGEEDAAFFAFHTDFNFVN